MIDPPGRTARERGVRSERCARCGALFGCGIDTQHCWCAQLTPLRELPAQPGSRCLCEKCLRDAIARQQERDASDGQIASDIGAGRAKNDPC